LKSYLEIGAHKTRKKIYVIDLGEKDMIIGYDFLNKHNPSIDWSSGAWP
jgi:hypothetical protein